MADSTRNETFLNERLDFIGLNQQARAALSKLQPLIQKSIGAALEAFYDKVKANPETRKFFGDERHMAMAKGAQERHWSVIAAANYSDDYASAVRKIGQTHARIGLEPRWYIGGYAVVIEQLIHAIVRDQWPRLLADGEEPSGGHGRGAFVPREGGDARHGFRHLGLHGDSGRAAPQGRGSGAGSDQARAGARRRLDRRRLGQARRQGSDLSAVVGNARRLSQAASGFQRGDRTARRRDEERDRKRQRHPFGHAGNLDRRRRPVAAHRTAGGEPRGDGGGAPRDHRDRGEIRRRRERTPVRSSPPRTKTRRRAPSWCARRSRRWTRSPSRRSRSARSSA